MDWREKIRCDYCGQLNKNSSLDCRKCGAPLPDTKYEPEIGMNAGQAFTPIKNDGTKLIAGTSAGYINHSGSSNVMIGIRAGYNVCDGREDERGVRDELPRM